MSQVIADGSVVRVIGIPELGSMPEETHAAFKAALGREFKVVGHGRYGHLELELGPALDAQLGGFMNTIWIEPELVEVVD
jgi:hypothetical protein